VDPLKRVLVAHPGHGEHPFHAVYVHALSFKKKSRATYGHEIKREVFDAYTTMGATSKRKIK